MPSTEANDQANRDQGQSSDSNPNPPSTTASGQPPSAQAPAGSTNVPVMGYPGYPGYPSPYPPPYQNAPCNQYPYARPPPATYYGSAYSNYPQRIPASGFFRGIFYALMILIILICFSSLITWLVLRPKIPSFSLNKFSVSGFNVSGPIFSAQWRANLTIRNPNTKLRLYLDRIESFVYHEDENDDDFLTKAFVQPVFLERKATAEVAAELDAGKADQPMVAGWVVEEMRKERESKGTVSFDLRFMVWATFKTEGWWTRHTGMKVFCEDLKVGFAGNSQNGDASLPKPLECLVYI